MFSLFKNILAQLRNLQPSTGFTYCGLGKIRQFDPGFRSSSALYCLLLVFCFQSCSLTKNLEPGEQLYVGAKVKINTTGKVSSKKRIQTELLELARPKPNQKFKLRLYNFFKPKNKDKGLGHWIGTKLGEPPVIYRDAPVSRTYLVMEKYLQDEGYFGASVSWDTVVNRRKVNAVYNVLLPAQTKVDSVLFTQPPRNFLDSLVLENKGKTFIKNNKPYQAEALKLERQRLADLARQNGYFKISPSDVYYYVDTTIGEKKANIYLQWRENKTQNLSRYRHGNIEVQPTYTLMSNQDSLKLDTIHYQGLNIIQTYEFLKPKALRRFIHDAAPEYYDGRKVASDLAYLQDIGVFKFVNVDYDIDPLDTNHRLDIVYQLTPRLTQRVRFDVDANTRTGNFLGTSVSGTYSHSNIFGGAEKLDLSLSAGLETQLGDTSAAFINTLELSGGASISLPFLLIPFFEPGPYRRYVARTQFSLSNKFQQREGFFSVNSVDLSMRYDWRSSPNLWHQVSPISISQITAFQLTESFKTELEDNPRLAASFEDILIWSGKYRMEYSSYLGDKPRPHYFGIAEVELAGNLLYGLTGFSGGQEATKILGVPFSQFFRTNLDFRYYYQWSKQQSWVFRVNAGVAIPYGNSSTIPYARQFFVGGANSIRAFRLRQLGPGSYVNTNATNSNFFDQTGDLKLELNTEYRFDFATYFEGAVFVDAGNIWLLDETIGENNEGQFNFSDFTQEIAVGTGLGFRIDLSYFVIRLDVAWPIRQPIAGNGFQWTVKDWDFSSTQWRQDNLVWHLAIGYPF